MIVLLVCDEHTLVEGVGELSHLLGEQLDLELEVVHQVALQGE